MKSYRGLMCPIILSNLSPEQILMRKCIPGPLNDNLRRRLELLILFIKNDVYSCKINSKTQWKIGRLH